MNTARSLEGKPATEVAKALLNAHYEGLGQAIGKGFDEINDRRNSVAGEIDSL